MLANNNPSCLKDLIPNDHKFNNFFDVLDHNGDWKSKFLSHLFEPPKRDVEMIKANGKTNNYVQIHNNNGMYTTRSARVVYKEIKGEEGSSFIIDFALYKQVRM